LEDLVSLKINGIKFFDSKSFLNHDLSTLIHRPRKNTLGSDFQRVFPILHQKFGSHAYFIGLVDRFCFPNKFLTSQENLNYRVIPEQYFFTDILTDERISKYDYQGACSLFRLFNCEIVLEFLQLYMIRNVLALADILVRFNNFAMNNFSLSIFHSCSLSSYSFDACFASITEPYEYLKDTEMIRYLQQAVKSGPCMSVIRKIDANCERLVCFNNKPNERS
jgi:hypothetical protein